jgi:sirohydrochlorin ferrochelatase
METPLEKTQKPTAVLLIAHGSRRPQANADLTQVAEAVLARGAYPIVEVAYLEIAEPTIPQGARNCLDRGAKRVLMLPYFLSAGNHVVEDIERHRRELSEESPEIEFRLCAPLGLHPSMVDVVLARLEETQTG